jgi:hypothetical protein
MFSSFFYYASVILFLELFLLVWDEMGLGLLDN